MKNTKNQRGAVSPSILVGVGVGVVVVVLLVLFFATDVFKKSSDNTNTATTTTKTTTNTSKTSPALKLGATPYTDSTYNYSIQYPEAWEKDTDDNITAIYTPEETDRNKAVLITINASTFNEAITQATFDEIVKQSREALKQFTGIKYTKDQSNNKGTTFGHIFEHDTTQQGVDLHSLQMIYMKGNKSYVITGQTLTSSWPELKSTMEATFDTFKIL